ncbi:YibE/F family protein [Anaeromicropila populeti]|uniref:Uncharacterized membrane protein n=1 Tax=Anaeromicropila populeti TaxID=37658 RepID=A0A1I6J800_9FIRM|nr:YibE/F family protein [Anaeromicropila populeti]SFR75092.1 Uncharacterized membrane protein [Anaeromicropila populeti]
MKQILKKHLPSLLGISLLVILIVIPTGYEDLVIFQGTEKCVAKVIKTDESQVISTGLIKSGEQRCELLFLNGKFKGQKAEGYNLLNGSLEADKLFKAGDKALVAVSYQENKILSTNMIDHYRMNKELILAVIFAVFLILFAGKTGARALLSFLITILTIWKVLVPCCLKGINPIFVGLAMVLILTVVILALVYGFDRRCLSAAIGSFLGIVTTMILGVVFTNAFQIHGAIMPNSESLLYSGYQNLNLTQIFMSSIFIGASGAVMDLAVDITSGVYEVVQKKPDLSWKEASLSGINIGRAAMGTMTTTLLLAYSGGYLALLMVFMAQGTPITNILNYKYVAAEILETIAGSFGLVTVAPFTALVCGFLLTKRNK